MKKFAKILLIILAGLLFFVCILYGVFFLVSPKPSAYIIRKTFEYPPAKPPANMDKILSKSICITDVEYPSDYPDNQLDIYLPSKESDTLRPIIIWIHGGGFVGGDKSDVRFFAQTLASEGYAVFSINYRRAPEEKYPVPFFQLNDAYKFVCEQSEEYQLDLRRLFLAGDSAGAQIVGQAANSLTNEVYGKSLPFQLDIPKEDIKGVLLYCGVFSVEDLSVITSNHFFVQLFKMVGWNYFGEKNWQQSSLPKETNVIGNATENFPPAFITDGNTMSFEPLAKIFVQKLDDLDVTYDSLFFTKDTYKTKHEYQFVQNTEAAGIAVEKTLAFLRVHS